MTTPNIGLIELSNSAGNYLLANESFAIIDALLGKVVKDKDLNAPPGSPANGDVYIIGPSPTGLWAGHANKLTFYSSTAGAWVVITPKEGWKFEPVDEDIVYRYDGSIWAEWSAGGSGGWDTLLTPAISSGTLTIDLADPAWYRVALDQNVTTINFTNYEAGKAPVFVIEFVQDATGGRTVTWPGSVSADDGGSIPALSSTANTSTVYSLSTTDGSNFKLFTGLDNGGNVDGNLTFIGNGRKILSQNSGTLANDMWFSSSTANTGCNVKVHPNGSGAAGGFIAASSSDLANYSRMQFFINNTVCSFSSNQVGSGVYQPMNFATNNLSRLWIELAGEIRPGADNTQNLGTASFRWKEIFAGTGTINTSDGTEKDVDPADWKVRSLTVAELEAAKALSKEIGAYRFKAAIQQKGASARMHIGMTVQRAIAIMEQHSLDPMAYGFICYDEWDERTEVIPEVDDVRVRLDENGNPELDENGNQLLESYIREPERTVVHPAGDRYGFRTDELLMFMLAGFEDRQAAAERRLAVLEAL